MLFHIRLYDKGIERTMSIRDAVCCGYCANAKNLNDSNCYRYCIIHQEWVSIDQVCDNHKEIEQ